jgi:hypothetical protein
VPLDSREAGYTGRVHVYKGKEQTIDIIVTNEDTKDSKSTIDVKFRVREKLVNFGVSFVCIDDASRKDRVM